MIEQGRTKGIVRFVITRPAGQGQSLASQLELLAGTRNKINNSLPFCKVDHLPLIAIEPLMVNATALEFSHWDGIVFISKNAFKYLKHQLTESQWRDLLDRPLYAIGKATAHLLIGELRRLGLKKDVVFPAAASTEGLLRLKEFNNISVQNWLIAKGAKGRKKLVIEMSNRGAIVQELNVYQRKFPIQEWQRKIKQVANTGAIWIITSVQALENLTEILGTKIQGCRVITSSDRISKIATVGGFQLVAQSDDATDNALVLCVKKLLPALGG